MKYTNLELVQAVLSSMDSDEINSVNDTVESQQVLEIVKTVYDDIISRSDLHSNKILFNLDASGDNTKPTIMFKPDTIDRIDWIKYNAIKAGATGTDWIIPYFVPVEEFIHRMHMLNTAETYIGTFPHVVDGFTIIFTYRTDISPSYFTSVDDNTVVFNSYDSAVDTTLQSSKTIGYGYKISDFDKTDAFVPNLQPQQFALLLNESKSLAWAELKQTQHAKAEQSARRNWIHLQKTRQQVPDGKIFHDGSGSFDKLPNFSRGR